MRDALLALAAAAPWILAPAVTIWRFRQSRDLIDGSAAIPSAAPIVSVIIPARDERHNIGTTLRAALDGRWPALEVIVVDDHSIDGTGEVARAVAREDRRVRVIENAALPDGWFGKSWACAIGAGEARGEILCFTDADARHSPELVARAVNEMDARRLDLLSVAGRQELGTFWERVVQPHVFWLIAMRYGGTEVVNRSRRVQDKIATGQCIFVRRAAYEALGGHGAVRDQVADDVALAQRMFASRYATAMILGRSQLTTRMYRSLAELVRGWRKNVFAGGREAMPWGRLGQLIFPLLLVLPPLLTLVPPLALLLGILAAPFGSAPGYGTAAEGGAEWLLPAAAIATAAELVTWLLVYRWMEAPLRYALLFPVGAAVFLGIIAQALARGRRVAWKGREYRAPTDVRHMRR